MTRDELNLKITALERVADGLEEPEKTFKSIDIDQLKMTIDGMALDDIANKLKQISLPSINEMDELIARAEEASTEHQKRVEYFDKAFDILKIGLRIVL